MSNSFDRMPQEKFTALSLEAMNALLPAFEFTNVMTSNAFGAVYFANQISLGRKVAIKVFSPAVSGDAGFRESFENASKAEAGLRHGNLVGLFDSGAAGEMLYRVMEFVPGKSLSRSTRGQMIEFGQAMALFEGICEGLSHAHGKGLVHGYLDTLNILLNQKAVPKLGNFGLDRQVHTDEAAVVTSRCVAPEVLAKPGAATVRSDVYSLGAIFYELITGKPLKPEAAPASQLTGCNKAIDRVLKQATAKDPAKRMANVQAFHTALKNAAAGLGQEKKNGAELAETLVGRDLSAERKPLRAGFDYRIPVKIAIIVGLLFGIDFLWKVKNRAHAERARENREIITRGERSKEAARALAEEMRQSNMAMPGAKPGPDFSKAPVGEFEPEAETPGESLARLKLQLAAGGRAEMPRGTVRRGDSEYFLVTKPMTWTEAAFFAERHGGHLAMPDADPAWLADQVTGGAIGWLGAARSGKEAWTLADGTPWIPGSQLADSGNCLAIGEDGRFSAADVMTPLPSVIQWRSDGSNPGTLAATLAATRLSPGGAGRVYPPGTAASGSRHYLYVPRPFSWKQAGELAESGGGHLMVPSDSEEMEELHQAAESIRADDGIWLGGTMAGNVWQWVTGEPWTEARWMENVESGGQDSAVAIRPGKGWDAMPRDVEVSGFLIEWSDDSKTAKTTEAAPAGTEVIDELTARVRELVFAVDSERGDALESNVKKFLWDLDTFLKKLNSGSREEWMPQVDALRGCVADNRISPAEIESKGVIVSTEMADLISYHLGKQAEISARFAGEMERIRDAFVTKLVSLRDEAEVEGQIKIVDDIAGIIEKTKDLEAWIRSFGLISDEMNDTEE